MFDSETHHRQRGARLHGSAVVPLLIGVTGMAASVNLTLGSLTTPGPGLWPFIVSAVMVLCSAPLIVTKGGGAGCEPLSRDTNRVAAAAASIAVFVVAFEHVGVILPAVAILLFWCRYLGRESWPTTIAVAVIAPLVGHTVFGTLLGVPFPDDLIAFWS